MPTYFNGPELTAAIEAAARDLSQAEFIVPAGTYLFPTDIPVNGVPSGLVLRDIRRPADNPFTIRADGTTFLFNHNLNGCPGFARAVHLCDCAHLVLDGFTVDGATPGALEGELLHIDIAGNRIGIRPFPDTLQRDPQTIDRVRKGSEFRIVPQKADGRAMAPLYNVVNQWGPAALWGGDLQMDAKGVCWFTFKEDTLMRTIFTPEWRDAYGDEGVLEPGDSICVVFRTIMAISLDNCREITVKNSRFLIGKGSFWENGGYGGHLWQNCYFGPPAGTDRILGTEGNMSQGLRHGSTYDRIHIHFTTDDAINIHGFWSRVRERDGCRARLDFAPVGIEAGDTAELYAADGRLVSTRKVVETPEPTYNYNGFLTSWFCFDVPLPEDAADLYIRWPNSECDGWVIRDSLFDNVYQRILVNSGSGVFERNLVRYMGSNVALTSTTEIYEGGFMHDITVRDNVFLHSANHPGASVVEIVQTPEWGDTTHAARITVAHNLMIGCGCPVEADNADGLTVTDNVIVSPVLFGKDRVTEADLLWQTRTDNVMWKGNRLIADADIVQHLSALCADPDADIDRLLREMDGLTAE